MLSSVYVSAAWRFSGASADIHRQTGTAKIEGCVLNLCCISRGWHSAQKEAERKTDRKQRQRGFRGRRLHCRAPAEWVCITWVNKALDWDVVFDRGVAPQQKNADKTWVSQHDCGDGSKSLGPSGICSDSVVDCSST